MTQTSKTYQAGDEIDINGTTVTLAARKGRNGIRWTWVIRTIDLGGESYLATPEEAIADAARTLNAPECRHGEPVVLFCVKCHDQEG